MVDDTISRQAAIEEIRTYITKPNISDDESEIKGYNDGLELAISVLSVLPSAQPERKKGKWIYGEDEHGIDGYHCSECGFFVPWDYVHKFINYIEDYDFCPHCCADMKKDGEQA